MNNKESLTPLIISLRLTIICFIAVSLLISVNALTIGKIQENSKTEEDRANKFLFANAVSFSEKQIFSSLNEKDKKIIYYFKAFDAGKNTLGYVVYSQGSGFGGAMKVGFSVDTDMKIIKIKLMDNSETPGYGKKYEMEENVKFFYGSNTKEKPLPNNLVSLSPEDKDTVTSATISFKGIAGALEKGVNLLKNEIK
ncbi:MAG: FMN-binding protein [Spirochaetes bacterium]|nr:FMN-binding protein [Spirochaetota bacterium]